jgi:hypothetical protein
MDGRVIDVGKEFFHRLANRDKHQGDGRHNAVTFRDKFLSALDRKEAWASVSDVYVTLDFSNVQKIGPSFANEAFGYFAQYASPAEVLRRIKIINATKTQLMIIEQEIEAGAQTK